MRVCHQHECLWLLLGVFTNLCCKTVDVRKRQWLISKNKIDQSINQLINQLLDKIIDQSINQSLNQSSKGIYWWLGVQNRRKNSGWGSETYCGYQVGWVELDRILLFARGCVCMCVCVCVCDECGYVLCVSWTGSRPCAIKMPGRLLEIVPILVLTSKL